MKHFNRFQLVIILFLFSFFSSLHALLWQPEGQHSYLVDQLGSQGKSDAKCLGLKFIDGVIWDKNEA